MRIKKIVVYSVFVTLLYACLNPTYSTFCPHCSLFGYSQSPAISSTATAAYCTFRMAASAGSRSTRPLPRLVARSTPPWLHDFTPSVQFSRSMKFSAKAKCYPPSPSGIKLRAAASRKYRPGLANLDSNAIWEAPQATRRQSKLDWHYLSSWKKQSHISCPNMLWFSSRSAWFHLICSLGIIACMNIMTIYGNGTRFNQNNKLAVAGLYGPCFHPCHTTI